MKSVPLWHPQPSLNQHDGDDDNILTFRHYYARYLPCTVKG